jgi:hypothetical protein
LRLDSPYFLRGASCAYPRLLAIFARGKDDIQSARGEFMRFGGMALACQTFTQVASAYRSIGPDGL